MKIYDGLYIPKGFQPEDKNGFVNLYVDNDMRLRIKETSKVSLKNKTIALVDYSMLPNSTLEYELKFRDYQGISWSKIVIKPGSFYFYNSEEDKVLVSAGTGFIQGYATITILEEPNDAAYEMLKKRSNYNFAQSITIKELVTQQDNELKFNNLSKLILGGGTNGTLSIQRPNTNQEIFQITGLNTNPKVFFKNHISIGDANTYVSYSTAFGSKPLQIRQAFISNGSINNGTITNNSEGNMVGLLFNETKEFSSENIDTTFSFFVDNDLKKGMVTYEIEVDVNSTIYRGFGTVFLKKGEISSTRIYQSGSNKNWLRLDWARSNNSSEIMLSCGVNEIDIKSLIVW